MSAISVLNDFNVIILDKNQLLIEEHQQNTNNNIDEPIITRTNGFKSYTKPNERGARIELKVWDKTKWLIEECDRKRAEFILKSAQSGTFLIRKSSLFASKGYYAMSIMCNHSIHHCLVQQYSNGFGFAKDRIFESLEELVFHYHRRETLNIHNCILNTHLLYPAIMA